MRIRKKNINRLMTRSWKRIVDGEIILMKFTEAADDGFLNAAKTVTYDPVIVFGCDIKTKIKKEETVTGTDPKADAVVYMLISALNGYEIDDRDLVNLGGVIDSGSVTGGTDYLIIDIGKGSFNEDGFDLKISLEKK